MSEPQNHNSMRSARREALVALVIWLMAMVYTVGYCVRYGYGRTAEDLRFVLGIPDWVFWGIFVPWFVCLALSWWFAFRFMTDESLGAADQPDDDVSGGFEDA
jgi:hypothetical protein